MSNKLDTINEIKSFLDGHNDELKYVVNVQVDVNVNFAECIIHEPGEQKRIEQIPFTPFMYMKDLKKQDKKLYNGDTELIKEKMIEYGIKIKKMKTGNQKRLEEGFCYKLTSSKSYNSIIYFLRDGGLYPYEKQLGEDGQPLVNRRGDPIWINRHLFFAPKPYEQFFIDCGVRLYKGFEEYKDIHKVVFDIETTGLRPEISRVFEIGVWDNRGNEVILEVDKTDDDEAEINLIRDFFNLIDEWKPAIIAGFNSEDFDFYYILERARILKYDLNDVPTSLKEGVKIRRMPNSTVKIGNGSEKYTATKMWGFSIIDIQHAAKRTAAVNSDLKNTKLKYLAQYEEVTPPNRTYIKGEDNDIGRYYHENPYFIANDKNEHVEIPSQYRGTAENMYKILINEEKLGLEKFNQLRKHILDNDSDFVKWVKKINLEYKENPLKRFVRGRKLVKQYLKDDLYETAAIDELYNQSAFMLAKIVPTNYDRICTMGTASIWNLLLTAWSYERDLAIPDSDVKKKFSGGLSRCYKRGYTKKVVKIDYASLYPMLQLTWDIFPIFDITNVFKKMLMYMTTTRNIYKKLGGGDDLNEEETELLRGIDHEKYEKFVAGTLSEAERKMFGIKQLPIKILNNSQFGALGSGPSFNWSDNTCAARITCCGRLELRHAVVWFEQFGCTPLYAVTDGVNFQLPDTTKIGITNEGITEGTIEGTIEEMWTYNGKRGINALINYFNDHEMKKPYMSVDNDGEFISCFNLRRINYATLQEKKGKKKIKYTGNSIKSKVMPEYIEEFMDNGFQLILEGKGPEFIDYYYDYVQRIFYKQIPLKKIASKSKYKHTLKQYLNRGTDKNGREKGKQAHMELILREREKKALQLFEEHKDHLELKKKEENMSVRDKMKAVEVYMPAEPALDSMLYYYNTGYRKSHGDSKEIKDKETDEMRYASTLINPEDLIENPEMTGDYNVDKYIAAFNERVCFSDKKIGSMLSAFDPEIAEKIPVTIKRSKVVDEISGKKVEREELVINQFTRDQLELKNFIHDDVQESMYLEEKEVEFWNETGFDPRMVWNGFKMYDDMKVYFEIYENALKYLNQKMIEKGDKRRIKSVNEKILKGEYVLIKRGSEYDVGYNNGDFIEIITSNVNIPKSDIEHELDKKREERELQRKKNLEALEGVDEMKSEKEKTVEQVKKQRMMAFDEMKERYKFPIDLTYQQYLIDAKGEGEKLIDQYVAFMEAREQEIVDEHMGID